MATDREFTVPLPNADGTVTLEFWGVSNCVKITCAKWNKGEQLRRHVQGLFLPYGDGTQMGLAVIRSECPPSVLADWIEDHLDLFVNKPQPNFHPQEPAIRLVAEWLRLAVGDGVVVR